MSWPLFIFYSPDSDVEVVLQKQFLITCSQFCSVNCFCRGPPLPPSYRVACHFLVRMALLHLDVEMVAAADEILFTAYKANEVEPVKRKL